MSAAFARWTPAALWVLSIGIAAGGPRGRVEAITFDDAPPATQPSALASLPVDDAEKLGWIVWVWDHENRRDPGQTFRVGQDVRITGVSILVASAENMGEQPFNIEFEAYADVDAVAPSTERLATYDGVLPADFDHASPGRWVTFALNRPMMLKADNCYAFRLAFDQVMEYELRRCFIRATNVDADGKPRSAVPGRMIHQTGESSYAAWGSVEDMIFVLRTD